VVFYETEHVALRNFAITAIARSRARTFFDLSNAGVMGSNPTPGIDVCAHLFCLCCPVYSQGPCDRLIHRLSSPTNCV
jgi:hypothetical protein